MTDNPCNCSTCPYPESKTPDAYKCPYLCASVDEYEGTPKKQLLPGRDRRYNFTKVCGCLSHPKAREYLNQEVIAELERSFQLSGRVMGEGCAVMTVWGVIKLLKEGVKK